MRRGVRRTDFHGGNPRKWQKGQCWKALQHFEEMVETFWGWTIILYGSAISACGKCRQWQQALEPFNRLWCDSVERDTTTYNAAMGPCEKGEQWQQALGRFQRMLGEGAQQQYHLQCCHQCL